MTVAALICSVEYNGNGVSALFPAPFRYLSPAHLEVKTISAAGVVTTLVLGVGYSATAGPTDAGGTVTCSVAPVAGTRLRIKRVTPRSQSTDYTSGDDFPAESHEAALDRAMLVDQEQDDKIDDTAGRAILAAEGSIGMVLPNPATLIAGSHVLGIDPLTGEAALLDGGAFKGDPGGNVMAIGLFAAANGMAIAAATTLVQTSGYAAAGVGAALYSYLAGQGIAGQAATRFTAADGRVFGLISSRPVGVEQAGSATNVATKLTAAHAVFDATRTSPPFLAGWGTGVVTLDRGNHAMGSTWAPYAMLGGGLIGHSRYATSIDFSAVGGTAISLAGYVGARLADFHLAAPGAALLSVGSIGLKLDGTGGGGFLSIERVDITGFDTCIRNLTNGNGDKTLVSECGFYGNTIYDNTGNTQAIGWTFLNCAATVLVTRLRLGGVGMTVLINDVTDIYGSMINYPEGSGNPGSNSWPGGTLLLGCKIEQHGVGTEPGSNQLVDASASKLQTDGGGSNTDLTLIDVHVTGDGATVPDPDNTRIMTVGAESDGNQGSNAIRVKAYGGWIRGVIQYCSMFTGTQSRRWSFERMTRAPLPEKAQLPGSGFHPLIEWRGNENVPVDQCRGGQSFIGSIDAEKAYLHHWSANELMRSTGGGTGSGVFVGPTGAIAGGNTGYGQMLAIGGFPAKCSFTGLGVFLDGNPGGSDVLVEWFADAGAVTLIGSMIVAGAFRGLRRMKQSEITGALPVGAATHVRLSKPGAGQVATGPIVLFYFPFMGT